MFFSNLNVHFLCTDVMITPLLPRLLRSFVKVKIFLFSIVLCTLLLAYKSEVSTFIHFIFKKG